ncbi:hypothetical protein KC19_10G023300 [Ceratodon purpureus]|uniref:Uncharacterized protein n=1 Tax=Ceratodon purpureus TaxID=3225 RepID=A0A8T0GKX2_CERPU|nr:hypothetical protein KC19_10G023300 [Ceratodon purpureus]
MGDTLLDIEVIFEFVIIGNAKHKLFSIVLITVISESALWSSHIYVSCLKSTCTQKRLFKWSTVHPSSLAVFVALFGAACLETASYMEVIFVVMLSYHNFFPIFLFNFLNYKYPNSSITYYHAHSFNLKG